MENKTNIVEEQQDKVKEKHIVKYIVEHWNELFKEFNYNFYKAEQVVCMLPKEWRCDIVAFAKTHINNGSYRAAIYTEVKYNNNSRDLLEELNKGLHFLKNCSKDYPRFLCVIIDRKSLSPSIKQFLDDNKISYFIYHVSNDDLQNLDISIIEHKDYYTKNIKGV